jgi:hypothetical protein
MSVCGLGARDLVDQRGGKHWIELEARGAAIAGAPVRPALFTDFFEVGVNRGRGAGSAHARNFCISRAKRKLTASVGAYGGAHAGLREL